MFRDRTWSICGFEFRKVTAVFALKLNCPEPEASGQTRREAATLLRALAPESRSE